jgi:hypothetical protein
MAEGGWLRVEQVKKNYNSFTHREEIVSLREMIRYANHFNVFWNNGEKPFQIEPLK